MKIFFFTTVFSPSVGGIERLAETLCTEFVELGHEVQLATMTPGGGEYPYPVVRRPRARDLVRLLNWCDVHIQANVALKYAWPLFASRRKFIFQHNVAYQSDEGSRRLIDHFKLALARHSHGIAVSNYTSLKTGAKNVVFNAYNDEIFSVTRPWHERESDLVFLGRLVSQKGCDTLLKALGRLRDEGLRPSLTVIGDGPDLPVLKRLSLELKLTDQVQFTGIVQGQQLARLLNHHRVVVVPSSYEEPFGIVALEGLACGCVPIVSARGGLVDAIGSHGFTFPNGDDAELAKVIGEVLRNPDAARLRLKGMETHLARCSARSVAEQYLQIFRQTTGAA